MLKLRVYNNIAIQTDDIRKDGQWKIVGLQSAALEASPKYKEVESGVTI